MQGLTGTECGFRSANMHKLENTVLVRVGADLGFSCTFIGAAWEAEVIALILLNRRAVKETIQPKMKIQS